MSRCRLAILIGTVVLLLLKMRNVDIDNGGPIAEGMINQQILYT